ncbi:sensor histidine kinase [Flavobacterium sp.]|jgi:signal transduction histidine kinase|uniref:sensor histidine kinase n=1 Tax=Flavobacterium sp. TaxID=239 RepID=UPI0037C02475
MTPFSFKNRIAFNYIISTAMLVFVVFFVIHSIVKLSVYHHVNSDISLEVNKHLSEIEFKNNKIILTHQDEWDEREHKTVDVNPVFVQFVDTKGKSVGKSPNLKNHLLVLNSKIANNEQFDTKLSDNAIRQIQVPLVVDGTKVGFLLVAMSLEDSLMVITNLSKILIIAYPLILVVLFLIARFIAGRSIKPVTAITDTASRITKDNLKSRIELPTNKDELFTLSETINNLLDQIENAIEREKEFTSDASHELRTPLAVIKGTLEVLIRKPREQKEYEEKINFCINEVNRVNKLVDQLLLLARFENQNQNIQNETIFLNAMILDTITRFSEKINANKLKIDSQFEEEFYAKSDTYLLSIILNNVISNAIKYSKESGEIKISLSKKNNITTCTITDNGIGIQAKDLDKIFNSFYRSDVVNHSEIKGTGLGLSIVKRLCDLLSISISISSQENVGTTLTLSIP